MNIAVQNLVVTMVRANLDRIPEFDWPPGFICRRYQVGDEAHWLRIHLAADKYTEITPELFQKQFSVAGESGLPPTSAYDLTSGINSVLRELGERQLYLMEPRGEIIGTATAWFNDGFEGGRWGRVHWVAIVPGFQGRGLAQPLMTAVCRRLRELGHERAYLRTSTARLAAIKLYRRFGFEPRSRSAEDERIWREIAC